MWRAALECLFVRIGRNLILYNSLRLFLCRSAELAEKIFSNFRQFFVQIPARAVTSVVVTRRASTRALPRFEAKGVRNRRADQNTNPIRATFRFCLSHGSWSAASSFAKCYDESTPPVLPTQDGLLNRALVISYRSAYFSFRVDPQSRKWSDHAAVDGDRSAFRPSPSGCCRTTRPGRSKPAKQAAGGWNRASPRLRSRSRFNLRRGCADFSARIGRACRPRPRQVFSAAYPAGPDLRAGEARTVRAGPVLRE